MIQFCILLLLSYSVVCDDCVTYDFETGFEELFSNDIGHCRGFDSWSSGNYSSLFINSPHENSKTFIFPQRILSCVSSFPFKMYAHGLVEINIYMIPESANDMLSVIAFQGVGNTNDPTVGMLSISAANPGFQRGWQTHRFFTSASFGSFNGYITFFGSASSNSILLVDSFRYIPTIENEDICEIYKNLELTSTTLIITTDIEKCNSEPDTITTDVPTDTTTTTMTQETSISTTEVPTETTTDEITPTEEQETTTPTVYTSTKIPTTRYTTTTEISSTTDGSSSTVTQKTSTTERSTDIKFDTDIKINIKLTGNSYTSQ